MGKLLKGIQVPPSTLHSESLHTHTSTYTKHPFTDQRIRGSTLNLSEAEDPCKKELGAPVTIVLKSTQRKSILGWQSPDWNSTCGGTHHCQSCWGAGGLVRATHTQGEYACKYTHTHRPHLFHWHNRPSKTHKRFIASAIASSYMHICTELHAPRMKIPLSPKWFHLHVRMHDCKDTRTHTQIRVHTCPGKCHSCVLMSAAGRVNLL